MFLHVPCSYPYYSSTAFRLNVTHASFRLLCVDHNNCSIFRLLILQAEALRIQSSNVVVMMFKSSLVPKQVFVRRENLDSSFRLLCVDHNNCSIFRLLRLQAEALRIQSSNVVVMMLKSSLVPKQVFVRRENLDSVHC